MKNWKTGIVVLGLAVSIVLFLFFHSRTPDPTLYIAKRFARNTGLSAERYVALTQISDKMGREPLSEADWATVEGASKSTALEYRVISLRHLSQLEKTPFTQRAHELSRRLALDSDTGTRCVALQTLVRMRDSQAVPLLKEAASSSDGFLKKLATDLLLKYPAGSS